MTEQAYWTAFGANLRRIRKQQKIKQINAAAQVGVHRNTLMRWERKGHPCTAWEVLQLSAALNVHPIALIRVLP